MRDWPFIWINMNPLHPRMLCTMFGWNCPSGSGERILNIFNIILKFCFHLPLDRSVVVHLNKFESPPSKDVLYHLCLKLASMVLEKKIFKYFQYNFTILLSSPLGEGRGRSFEQIWIPSIQGCFVPSLLEIGLVVLEKKILQYFQYNFTISLLSPHEKGVAFHLNKFESPPIKWYYVPSLVKIGPMVFKKKIFKYCQ